MSIRTSSSDRDKDKSKVANKVIINTKEIYQPVGPYSQAVLANGNTLYISGVLGMDKEGKMAIGVEAQANQALENLKFVVEAGGGSMLSICKTTILLNNIENFTAVNQIYGEYFPSHGPARATFQVAKLPLGAEIEIEAIAISGDLVIAEAGPCPCSKDKSNNDGFTPAQEPPKTRMSMQSGKQ